MSKQHSTFRKWFDKNMDSDTRRCIREYGAAMTAPVGMIYYAETTELYRRYKEEIWEIVLGSSDGGIGTLIKRHDLDHPVHFENWMVWAAAEILA
jgi:hypothetical protein